jgi:hypothetical protein
MIDFNPDGSIKIPGSILMSRERTENRLKKERFVFVRKDVVDFKPKKCVLHLRVSDAFFDSSFVSSVLNSIRLTVFTKLIKISEKEFDIEIGTDFKRCSDCTALLNKFRGYLDGNLIEDKGSCSMKERVFGYDEYFE